MKKHLMVLAPFFFLIAIFSFVEAYSLFESNRVNKTKIEIAKWQVKINEDQINGNASEFTIDNINWNSSQNVKEGKVAPGMTGYFDIEIDPNDTETSIRYDVTFDFTKLNTKQFRINEIKEIDNKEIVRTGINTYSNIIRLDEIRQNETNTLRVLIEWVNDDENDEIDSELGTVYDNKISIPVVVEITQYIDGDLLEEYIEEIDDNIED